GYFGDKVLSDVNGTICRTYVKRRGSIAAARRELEDLRAAINHHRREGLCSAIVEVVLPEASPARERWLTREEAARLLWAAWHYREVQKGKPTGRRSRQHIARFILLALYTGTRAGAICGAALQPTVGRGWIDVARGVFYRRPEGERETKKRKPPVPLPPELHGHVGRWKRRGPRFAVEWLGEPVSSIKKAFRAVAEDAGLGPNVTPHVLRHTAATWLMQAGTDPWEAAGFLGMTVETLMNRYGHHHPDYLSDARGAFSRHRYRHRNTTTEREQQTDNNRRGPRRHLATSQYAAHTSPRSRRGAPSSKPCHSDQSFSNVIRLLTSEWPRFRRLPGQLSGQKLFRTFEPVAAPIRAPAASPMAGRAY